MPKTKEFAGPCAYYTNNTPWDEAVICSNCEEIAYRYCVGVPLKQFSAISESSPYTCVSCQRDAYQSTINKMQDTIIALQMEIAELHSALTNLSKRQEHHE